MKTSELKKQLKELQNTQVFESAQCNSTRARSISVGNAFGGTTEISLRGDGGRVLWVLLQPAEVTELIHQLAANIGCHIHIQPRNDFASWRQWKETTGQLSINTEAPWSNHPPHAKIEHENQPGLSTPVRSNENVVATEKTVNRRSAKRAAKAA
jgi:hypothetical protein